MAKNKVLDPLNDYQLLELSDGASGTSFYFANVDTIGVEGTPTLENTAKPYVVNEETGEPGVVTGEPLNSVPRDDTFIFILFGSLSYTDITLNIHIHQKKQHQVLQVNKAKGEEINLHLLYLFKVFLTFLVISTNLTKSPRV